MKYVSLDIETTGLDPANSHPIEFGAILDDTKNQLSYEESPKFHSYLLPEKRTFYGDPYALSMHPGILRLIAERGKSENAGRHFLSITALTFQFGEWLKSVGFGPDESVNIAGKNAASFDLPYLKATVPGWKGLKLRHRVIDVGNLFVSLDSDDKLPDLKTCLVRGGLGEPTAEHTALGDCWDVIRLVRAAVIKEIK